MYGASRLETKVDGIGDIILTQETDYPWDGNVTLKVEKLKARRSMAFDLALRMPSWTKDPVVSVNGETVATRQELGYLVINRVWKQGDVVTLDMPMAATVVEANPLVEESRGQVAVVRGPIVYCLESQDLSGVDIDNIALPVSAQFRTVETIIDGSRVVALETEAYVRNEAQWDGQLYRPVAVAKQKKVIRFIPYFAWGNRGKGEMTVWLPAVY